MRNVLPRSGGEHAGLLLQRYHNGLCDERDRPKARSELFARVRQCGPIVRPVYEATYNRWKSNLPEITATAELATAGRLIVGLGAQNVLETGLTLHHTYGVPIIPGSALKGLASHYCAELIGEGPDQNRFRRMGEYHNLLFGTTRDGGVIIFHDAWIVADSLPTAFKKDVMTPHHPDYQRDPVKDKRFRPPTDFDSPTPVSFLSVSGEFLVAVSWAGPVHAQSLRWTNLALNLLMQALDRWGMGGKTSSGYGRLVCRDRSRIALAFSPSALGLPPVGKVRTQFMRNKKGKHRGKILTGDHRSGPIINSEAKPVKTADQSEVELIVVRYTEKGVEFRWPD